MGLPTRRQLASLLNLTLGCIDLGRSHPEYHHLVRGGEELESDTVRSLLLNTRVRTAVSPLVYGHGVLSPFPPYPYAQMLRLEVVLKVMGEMMISLSGARLVHAPTILASFSSSKQLRSDFDLTSSPPRWQTHVCTWACCRRRCLRTLQQRRRYSLVRRMANY